MRFRRTGRRWARAYGENLEYSGPPFRQATVEGEGLRMWQCGEGQDEPVRAV